MRPSSCTFLVFCLVLDLIAATPKTGEVVKMDPVKVHALGMHEFVPCWVLDSKPPKLVLRSAERVWPPQAQDRWLIRSELGVKDGDEIVSVNGKRVGDAGFLDFWRPLLKDGIALALELKSVGSSRSRKVDYVLATKPRDPPPKKKK